VIELVSCEWRRTLIVNEVLQSTNVEVVIMQSIYDGALKSLSNLNAEIRGEMSFFSLPNTITITNNTASINYQIILQMKFIPPLALIVLPVTHRLSSEHKNLRIESASMRWEAPTLTTRLVQYLIPLLPSQRLVWR
jgi:hypothetical protein